MLVAPQDNGAAAAAARQARFVNLDGKVQIKKVNSLQWVNADYQITLDKGDEIETGSDGVARVSFADGTEYTVKGDTFVTVEENTVAHDHASQVAVHLNTGQVDLEHRHLADPRLQSRSFLSRTPSPTRRPIAA